MTQTNGSKGFGERVAQERRLKSVRDRRDVEKRDIAKAMGVSNSTVSRWLDGAAMPDPGTIERLAGYFGVTPAWLLYGQEPREAPKLVPLPDMRKRPSQPVAKASGTK
jgi:transcriptional regulator with XRE-family HTH domain